MNRINVTKTFLPPIKEYEHYLEEIWQTDQLTNQGSLLASLEERLKQNLKVKNLQMVANGTLALQLSLRALGITEGEVITTPFSYVATTSSILWEHCTPVFVDIEADSLCIDPAKIEAAITKNTKAILPVHIFGFPCDTEEIEKIAKKHKLRVIYDGSHAFGVSYKDQPLLDYGDIATCSFHATKLFHTIEGGCIVTSDNKLNDKLELLKRFGHNGDQHFSLGINAKISEFHAAMGLCNLKYVDDLIEQRKEISLLYDKLLGESIQRPTPRYDTKYNYGYYPVIMKSEKDLLRKMKALEKENIFPRRYFYPSLNTLPYLKSRQSCPVSEDIAVRIICLPLYPGLEDEVVKRICNIIKS